MDSAKQGDNKWKVIRLHVLLSNTEQQWACYCVSRSVCR